MGVKAVLFDKDGTLLDFQRTWGPWAVDVVDQLAGGNAALAGRMDAAWRLDRASQTILPGSVVVAGTVQQVAGAMVALRRDLTLDQMVEFLGVTGAQAQPVPVLPLQSFLDGMAGLGLKTGVATNDSEATARAQLRALDVEHRFDFIAGYDSGFGGKPAPGMCLAFAEQIGVDAVDVVMVGDSAHDLQAGRAAGMQTVAVLSGVARAAELAPLADCVLADISALAGWLAE